jgi:hypothetical protein
MQVLTTECVTSVKVSVRVSSTRFAARRPPAGTMRHKAEPVRRCFVTLWLYQSASEFDRAAVLENSDRTTSHARRSRTRHIRARV